MSEHVTDFQVADALDKIEAHIDSGGLHEEATRKYWELVTGCIRGLWHEAKTLRKLPPEPGETPVQPLARVCVNCQHFKFSEGEEGSGFDSQSMMLPVAARMSCNQKIWEQQDFDGGYVTASEFRACILAAETCQHFEPIEETPDTGAELTAGGTAEC